MAYPESIDTFTKKLNKLENNTYVIEEEINLVDGMYEGDLQHDNISLPSLAIYTGTKLTGEKVQNYILTTPSNAPWKRRIKIFNNVSPVYITYETQGDTVEADDINRVQESIVNAQKTLNSEIDRSKKVEQSINDNLNDYKQDNNAEIQKLKEKDSSLENKKSDKTYLDTELNKRYLKEQVFNKDEVLQKIKDVIGTAPEALDTLQEIAEALNNDANFAGTMTNELSKKVDKVQGKQLSTEDYVTVDKNKLAGIEQRANKYIHPSSHSANIIVENESKRFASDAEKSNYNEAYNKRHEHSNKCILDNITQSLINAWNTVSNKSDKVHHHIKSEILDFPTSLPASGGNADTVGGKSAYAFAPAGYGLGTISVDISNTDLNNCIVNGLYRGCNLTNAPDTNWYTVFVQAGSTQIIQMAIGMVHPVSNIMYTRVKLNNNSWEMWKQVSTIEQLPTKVSQLINDSNYVTKTQLSDASYGDMIKSTYDKNNNGKVDFAENADRVPWNGIEGKPNEFPPNKHIHTSLSPIGRKAASDLPSTWPIGLYMTEVYDNGFPCPYGNCLTLKSSSSAIAQICMEWKSPDATIGSMWIRNKRDCGIDKFSNFREFSFTEHNHDNRYVKKGPVTWKNLKEGV